jgi:Fe2+ transport system protein FeoA
MGVFMTLIEGEKNGVYRVKEMNVEQPIYSMRLKSIGVNNGSQIKVINKKRKGRRYHPG